MAISRKLAILDSAISDSAILDLDFKIGWKPGLIKVLREGVKKKNLNLSSGWHFDQPQPTLRLESEMAESKMAESKMAESKMAKSKMAGSKMAGSKMTESKMAKSKMAESKMAESKMVEI